MQLIKRLCERCGRRTSTCSKCHHRSYCYFCNNCSLHGQDDPSPEMIRQRDDRRRQWVVQVAFLTRRGWSDPYDVRVRARGMAGAIWHGVRQARREHLKARTRVQQARVVVFPA